MLDKSQSKSDPPKEIVPILGDFSQQLDKLASLKNANLGKVDKKSRFKPELKIFEEEKKE